MSELPPPQVPTPPPVAVMQREYRGMKVWQWLLVAAVPVTIAIAALAPEDEPEPPRIDRSQIAQQSWDRMGLTDRAAMCDGYRMGGESFTVDNLLAGTDGDEQIAEALLDVIRREC